MSQFNASLCVCEFLAFGRGMKNKTFSCTHTDERASSMFCVCEFAFWPWYENLKSFHARTPMSQFDVLRM